MAEPNSKNQPKNKPEYQQSQYPNTPNSNYNPNYNPYGTPDRNFQQQPGYYNSGNHPQTNYPPVPVSNDPRFRPNPNQPSQQPPQQPPKEPPKKKARNHKDWGEIFSRIFVAILVCFILVYMGWLYAPRIRNSMEFWPTNTPTPITPTPTRAFTPTVTPLASNTPTLEPTATPGPLSAYWIANGLDIDPVVPDAPDGVVVLSVDKSAEVNPVLSDVLWTSSDKIAADLGKSTYDENWYATYTSGWIRWFMDRPLREGLYEIYTMDTVYSSGGTLDFTVKLGEQILTPLTGSQQVVFMTSQYEPQQSADVWRSLGMYYINPSLDILTVTTSWEDRDEYTIVSVDRLLIVPRRVTDLSLLNSLAASGTKYIADDLQAEILGGDYLITQKEQSSWDDTYQLVMNPKMDVTVTFNLKEPWPIGNYQLFAWMPASKGGITATVKLYADNSVLASDSGEETVNVTSPASQSGSWVSIGSWTTDRYYERSRKFKLTFEIPADAAGEFPIDAVAFVHNGFAGE